MTRPRLTCKEPGRAGPNFILYEFIHQVLRFYLLKVSHFNLFLSTELVALAIICIAMFLSLYHLAEWLDVDLIYLAVLTVRSEEF